MATFVFCSVPDPVQALEEIDRVVKPCGRVMLLEHVRVNMPIAGALIDLFDPLMLRLVGPHMNRRTGGNVQDAGLEIQEVKQLATGGLVKLVLARSTLGRRSQGPVLCCLPHRQRDRRPGGRSAPQHPDSDW